MASQSKISRNDQCPCLSGKKYKRCCLGKVDWDTVIQQGRDYPHYLSVRGRNLLFVERIQAALQLESLRTDANLKDYKAAFTVDAVRKIHEAVMELWPPNLDVFQALQRSSEDVSGLYIGDYDPPYIARAIVRHSIYANKILLVDPFIHPKSVRDEYNPILNPGQYRWQTLKNANLWFALLPWVQAGIVELIHPPAHFDHRLNWEFMKTQEQKFKDNPELMKAAEKSLDELGGRHIDRLMFQQLLLGAPDSYLRQIFEEQGIGRREGYTVDGFLKFIHEERERDLDFLEPLGPEPEGQLHVATTGACYPSAKMTAIITGSYLFTDLHVRWREIELDRESHSAENKVWAPFAKALQNTSLKYLNNLRLEHALTLRKEARLESLRRFLRKVWASACTDEPFDDANSLMLAEELAERIREAETEWKQIDRDLLKIVGAEAVPGILAAGPLIAAGHPGFLAAAVAVAGVADLAGSTLKRRSFPDRFPAAFFMKIQDKDT